MKNKFIEINESVIKEYNKLNRTYHFKIEQKNQDNVNYIVNVIKENLLNLDYCESDICDMLVRHLYSNRKTPHKEILWKCFGDVIVNNLKQSIPDNSIQCEKCGERFVQTASNQKLCDTCSTYQPIENKTIICIDCGCKVEVDNMDNETCRCEIHKKIYLKEIKKQQNKRYYENKCEIK